MEHYSEYKAENFVLDESFQEWVLHADGQSAKSWNNWLQKHPYKKEEVDKARNLILEIRNYQNQPEFKVYHQVWQKIQQDVDDPPAKSLPNDNGPIKSVL